MPGDENLNPDVHIPITDEVLDPQAAHDLGEVAISEEDQALRTAQNDDPEHPRGNPDLAYEMAHEQKLVKDVVANLKKNLQNAGIAETEAQGYIADLEENAEGKAERAKSRYLYDQAQERKRAESEKRNFERLKSSVVSEVLAVTTGKIVPADIGHPLFYVDAVSLHAGFPPKVSHWQNSPHGEFFGNVSPEHIYEARNTIYAMLGAEPPESDQFEYTGENYPPANMKERFQDWFEGPDKNGVRTGLTSEVVSPGNLGFSILEQRQAWLRPDGSASGLEPGVSEGPELKGIGISIVSTEVAEELAQAA